MLDGYHNMFVVLRSVNRDCEDRYFVEKDAYFAPNLHICTWRMNRLIYILTIGVFRLCIEGINCDNQDKPGMFFGLSINPYVKQIWSLPLFEDFEKKSRLFVYYSLTVGM